MPEIGLTGGIGAGKSTVSVGLATRGAVLIDTDDIVQQLQMPGKPVFKAMVERWGSSILCEDGTLNRSVVADIVFRDDAELAVLNAIVHPSVATVIQQRLNTIRKDRNHYEENNGSDKKNIEEKIVVIEIPLLAETKNQTMPSQTDSRTNTEVHYWNDLDGIVTVDTDPEIALQRLVEKRGFTKTEALARIASQASRDTRIAIADFVIDNNSSYLDLEKQIDACWLWACTL